MSGAQEWLLGILAACILCSVAESLMPSGPVKRVGKLVCGLVLLCALLAGTGKLDWSESQRWAEQWNAQLELEKQDLEDQVNEEMKVIIEEKFEAYIVDKAAEMGLVCTPRVSCRMEGELWVPEEIRVTGTFSAQELAQLEQCLQEELGVSPERQVYEGEEGTP